MAKLILVNLVFFLVVAGGIMFASGNSEILGLFGGMFGHMKNKDDNL